jgi:ERCC4-type nuclease
LGDSTACFHARHVRLFLTACISVQDGVVILVDTREGGRNYDLQLAMCQHLEVHGVTYRTETLPFADYL